MHTNEPKMAKKWEKEEKPKKESKVRSLIKKMVREITSEQKLIETVTKLTEKMTDKQIKQMRDKFMKTGKLPPHLKKLADLMDKHKDVKNIVVPGLEWMSDIKEGKLTEKAKRDYKAEYKKYGSSTKAKKYRAELNKYNRQKGTYGNGDKKDASHRGGKIVGFEAESKNRGRAEKSRLKQEVKLSESKAVDKVLYMADHGYGKLGGKLVDGMSANLFKQVYEKSNDKTKEKINTMNEKQLYVFMTKLWSKFGKQVKI